MSETRVILEIPHPMGGKVTAARFPNEPTGKAVARLINNEKGTWYNGRADEGNICEGEDALLYEFALDVESINKLVTDGYAEYA